MDYNDITRPSHYCEGRSFEPIEVINDWNLDFDLGNVVKYISRAGRKDSKLKDLKKALFYLNHAVKKESKKVTVAEDAAFGKKTMQKIKEELKNSGHYDSYQCGPKDISSVESDYWHDN